MSITKISDFKLLHSPADKLGYHIGSILVTRRKWFKEITSEHVICKGADSEKEDCWFFAETGCAINAHAINPLIREYLSKNYIKDSKDLKEVQEKLTYPKTALERGPMDFAVDMVVGASLLRPKV